MRTKLVKLDPRTKARFVKEQLRMKLNRTKAPVWYLLPIHCRDWHEQTSKHRPSDRTLRVLDRVAGKDGRRSLHQ
jgi:hypothetical protein